MRKYSVETAIKRMCDFGIPTELYRRPVLGTHVFALGISDRHRDTERIRIWPGVVDHISLAVDHDQSQLIFLVHEDGAELHFNVTMSAHQLDNGEPKAPSAYSIWRWSNVNLPQDTKTVAAKRTGPKPRLVKQGNMKVWRPYWTQVRLTARTPKGERCFLIGKDVGSPNVFISMLPKTVDTVQKAHRTLRPRGVPADAIRQGEFFFVPDPEYEPWYAGLEKNAPIISKGFGDWYKRSGAWNARSRYRRASGLESDHIAEEIIVSWKNNKQRVRGEIKNRRHETRVLDGWHSVIPNREVEPPPAARSLRWD